MTLGEFLEIFSLIIGFIGTFFLLKGVLHLTAEVIGEIGQTRLDYSVPVIENLSAQKADTVIGFVVVCIAFFVQIVNALLNLEKITLTGSFLRWAFLNLGVCALFLIIALGVNHSLQSYYKYEAGRSILRWYFGHALDRYGIIPRKEFTYIGSYAKNLLRMERQGNETDTEYVKRLARTAGHDIDDKIESAP